MAVTQPVCQYFTNPLSNIFAEFVHFIKCKLSMSQDKDLIVRQEAMFRIAWKLSDPFGISLSKRALLVTVSCEALETTGNKQEPALTWKGADVPRVILRQKRGRQIGENTKFNYANSWESYTR